MTVEEELKQLKNHNYALIEEVKILKAAIDQKDFIIQSLRKNA